MIIFRTDCVNREDVILSRYMYTYVYVPSSLFKNNCNKLLYNEKVVSILFIPVLFLTPVKSTLFL